MEMGLDSADMMTLTEELTLAYEREFETAFFFQYNTAERKDSVGSGYSCAWPDFTRSTILRLSAGVNSQETR